MPTMRISRSNSEDVPSPADVDNLGNTFQQLVDQENKRHLAEVARLEQLIVSEKEAHQRNRNQICEAFNASSQPRSARKQRSKSWINKHVEKWSLFDKASGCECNPNITDLRKRWIRKNGK